MHWQGIVSVDPYTASNCNFVTLTLNWHLRAHVGIVKKFWPNFVNKLHLRNVHEGGPDGVTSRHHSTAMGRTVTILTIVTTDQD